jgi:hypothetical protein
MTDEMKPTIDEVKRECLERWQATAPKRRAIAMQILARERDFDPNWPNWVCHDVRAEMVAIEAERERLIKESERRKKEHAAKEAQKDFLL